MLKRVLSMLLALSMLVSFCPQYAFAEENTEQEAVSAPAPEEQPVVPQTVFEPEVREELPTETDAIPDAPPADLPGTETDEEVPAEELPEEVTSAEVISEDAQEETQEATGYPWETMTDDEFAAWIYAEENHARILAMLQGEDEAAYASFLDRLETFEDQTELEEIYLFLARLASPEEDLTDSVQPLDTDGQCGESAFWEYDSDTRKLTITGTGAVANYAAGEAPWYAYRSEILNISVSNGITRLGAYSFYNCTELTEFTIPEGVTDIGWDCFSGCTALTDVTFPANHVSVGQSCFANCTNIQRIHISDLSSYIKMGAYQNAHPFYYGRCSHAIYLNGQLLTEVVIPEDISIIHAYSFKNCTDLTSLTIPENVTYIDAGCFAGCTGLESVTMFTGVDSPIGVFSGSNIKSLNILPGSSTCCNIHAIYDCAGVESITFGEGITSLGINTFKGCTNLTSITIPASLTKIGNSCFSECKLRNIYISDLSAYLKLECDELHAHPFDASTASTHAVYLNGQLITDLVIPDDIAAIPAWSFSGCTDLTSVTIPSSLTSIGVDCFRNCSNIENLYIADLAAYLKIRYDCPFYNSNKDHTLYLNGKPVTELVIPEGITSIPAYSFRNCTGLTAVTIPKSVTSIDDYSFYGCSSLNSVTFAEGVTAIGQHSFQNCTGLTSVTIPKSVTSFGNSCFSGCGSLESVVIPSDLPFNKDSSCFSGCNVKDLSVTPGSNPGYANTYFSGMPGLESVTFAEGITSIGSSCFEDCTGLTSVSIPESMTSIGSSCFFNCSNIENLYVADLAAYLKIQNTYVSDGPFYNSSKDHTLYLNGKPVTELVIPEGITSIPAYSFRNCTGLTAVTIPKSVTSIGDYSFSGCSGLEAVTLPSGLSLSSNRNCFDGCSIKSLTVIPGTKPDYTSTYFYGKTGLESVTFAEGITSIGSSCFEDCTGLTSVSIPESVTSIGSSCFQNCTGLTSVAIPKNVTAIDGYGFSGCSSLKSVSFAEGITTIGYACFQNCTGLTTVTIPGSVTSVGSRGFSGCSSLVSLTLPSGLIIGDQCFDGCNVKTLTITPGSKTDYTNTCFNNMTGLESVTFAEGVTSIGSDCFNYCSSLRSVTIPASVASIGAYCFSCCYNIRELSIQDLASYLKIGYGNDKSHPFYASDKPHNLYLNGKLLTELVIPEGVSIIPAYSFRNCGELLSMAIPEGVTGIGSECFSGCGGLTELTIPASLTQIGASAFSNCSGIQDLSISDLEAFLKISYADMYAHPFADTFRPHTLYLNGQPVTELEVPRSFASLKQFCFLGLNGVTSITIPDSITVLPEYCFAGCSGLTTLTLPERLTKLPRYCFAYCTGKMQFLIPTTNIPAFCFYGGKDLTLTVPARSWYLEDRCFANISNLDVYFLGSAPSFSSAFRSSMGYIHYNPTNHSWDDVVQNAYVGDMIWIPSLNATGITGKCGTDTYWILTEDGALYITGTGCTDSYSLSNLPPFAEYRDSVTTVVVEPGVTALGSYLFSNCTNLASVTLPDTNILVGSHCFDNCGKLQGIRYADSTPDGPALPAELTVSCGSEPFALDLSFLPEEIRGDVTFASSKPDIASVDENGIVTLTGKPGTVTVTITDPQGRVEPTELLLCIDEQPDPETLTAVTDIPAAGLLVNASAHLTVYAGTETVAPESLTYTVTSGTGSVSIDPDGTIHALKPGYAVIRADLGTGSGMRSVSISVLVRKNGNCGSFGGVFGSATVPYSWDEETASLCLYSTPKENAVFTVKVSSGNVLTFTTTDAKVAKPAAVKGSSDMQLTIPKGAIGSCTITAAPKDKNLKDAAITLNVSILDVSPKVGSTKLTMNSYLTAGTATSLVPSEGNAITRRNLLVKERVKSASGQTEWIASTQFTAEYKNEMLTIRTVNGEPVRNQTANLRVVVSGYLVDHEVDLTLTVKNALPKVTAKQTVKPNTFYASAEGTLSVTAAGAAITDMDFAINGYTAVDNHNGTLTVTADGTTPAKSGTLTVHFKGYNTPVILSGVAFAAATAKPALACVPAVGTVSAAGEDASVLFGMTAAKLPMSLSGCTVSCSGGFTAAIEGDQIRLTPNESLLNVEKKTAYPVTISLSGSGFEGTLTAKYSLTVLPAVQLPTAKLTASAVTLNTRYPDAAAEVGLALDQSNRRITGAEFTSAQTDQIRVEYADGKVQAKLLSNAVPLGTYRFTGTLYSGGDRLNDVILSVKVINTKATVTAAASGSLDAIRRQSGGITYALTLKNASGKVTDVTLIEPKGSTSASVVDGSGLFDAVLGEPNAAGLPTVILTQKPGVTYSGKVTYLMRLCCQVENVETLETVDLKVKVGQSKFTATANPAAVTLYKSQSSSRVVTYQVNMASPEGLRIGRVEIGSIVPLFQNSLSAAASNIAFAFSPDGRSVRVYVTMRDISSLTAGKTYTVPLLVYAEGQNEDTPPAKCSLTLTVKN